MRCGDVGTTRRPSDLYFGTLTSYWQRRGSPLFQLVIRNLARVFVNAEHMQARGSTFAELLRVLGDEFIPQPVAELTATGAARQRLGAATANGEWSVVLVSESIDVTYSPRFGGTGVSFEEFCARAARYLEGVHRIVGQPAHRVALVREGIDRKSSEQLDALATRLVTREPPFDGPLFEWDWRVGTRVRRAFGAHNENTNTFAILKRVEVTPPGQEPADWLWASSDVNTPPQERRPRFSPTDAAAFVNAAHAWHADLEVFLQTLVEGN